MPKTPTKAELLQRLQSLEADVLTRGLATVDDLRNEPQSTLGGLTAERVHAAITNAEQGDTQDLFSIYRDVLVADTHIASVIDTRFLAVLGDEVMISPVNPENPDDVSAAEAIKAAVDRLPDFMGLCADLLWGTIWPLAVVERTYKRADIPGLVYDWGEVAAVPDHLFRWTNGCLEIAAVDATTRRPTGEFFKPEPTRYLTHRGHLMRHPDCWGGPMRALAWWFFLKVMDREWWVRFLDRFGTPFPVAKFEKNDDRSRQILERALKLSSRIGGLVVSSGTSVELAQASTAAADAHEKFFCICNDEISRRVLGQTLSSTASPTGIGNGASDLQSQVRGDISQFDKKRLAQTLRTQFFKPWLRLNQFRGAVPNLTFGGEEPEENSTTAEVLSKLKAAGLRLADKSLAPLSKRIGLEIERDPAPAADPGAPSVETRRLSAALPLSEAGLAANSISREAAAALSQVYRGSLAPVRQIILESPTPEACQTRLLSTFVDWTPERAAEVVESAVVAGAWNGVN